MNSLLREHPDDLSVLVTRASAALGIPASYVEKDFWVTEVLRAACADRQIPLLDGATGSVSIIFKGGTSLSRVFGIIDRFSEDIDLLAVFPEKARPNPRHTILKRVDADVTAHLDLTTADVSVDSSTTGVKRYTTYRYPTSMVGDGIREGVFLELGSRGGTFPTSTHAYRSMVAEFAITALGEDENTWEEFAAFNVRVLSPERTLLEKIAAVHDAATRNDTQSLLKHGRHFYDIYHLLRSPIVVNALDDLGPDGILSLIEDVDARSDAAGFTWSPRPTSGYADSPAFDIDHPSREAIAIGYQNAQNLIHGATVTFQEVVETVAAHREYL